MADTKLPRIVNVEVIGTQSKPADLQRINFIETNENITLSPVTYIVKIALENPEVLLGGHGVMLYVGEHRVEKYSGYKEGIFFKVHHPDFFRQHAGKPLRFSSDGETFTDTGQMLPDIDRNNNLFTIPPTTPGTMASVNSLPTQEEVLR